MADRFFREIRIKPGLDMQYKLTENFIALTSPSKAVVQQALSTFLEMCKPEDNQLQSVDVDLLNVRAILGRQAQ